MVDFESFSTAKKRLVCTSQPTALPAESQADLPLPVIHPPPPLPRSHRPTPTGERKIGRELAIQLLPRHLTHDAGSSRALATSPRSDIPAAPPACGLPADVPYLPLYFIWQVLAASPPVQSRHHGAAPKLAGFSGQIRLSPPLDARDRGRLLELLAVLAIVSSPSPRTAAVASSNHPTAPPLRRRSATSPLQPHHPPRHHAASAASTPASPRVPPPSRRPAVSPLGDQGLM
ncbi:hypothetical protein GQ55_9G219200 [Panicum hallii var. hallii]|uniref:Uncharacterized protein n=1 Tax=Panicum hallii var. hallii TaxID=1504633 RepID=A0A2T7C5W3_9POAL|nr:hypothetical protein GQ55_9G219200 [Panicum hallii var. hallii]PUZ38721.1 hypothetical protein GQ55_9G219200 [Panicum hallii var. hallii]PUZ38722.1 hypothetical protein GQ55_9G219200 [Panicum hallii var. hallii]PUZ38723.1 hypothetical protein GQ55_9G219200 [Panicum hallii var. hallii]PUZ38724.1 hypothetical protein GQ55_9G219200 [Panicum hallii var. hallii]